MSFTRTTLGPGNPDATPHTRSVDDGPACGRPFQDAAAVLVDPEDEPDGVEDFDADPDDDPESEDEEDDDAEVDSVFFSLEPFEPFELLSFEPESFDADDDPFFAGSRLSLR
jgi:hypothetical protein